MKKVLIIAAHPDDEVLGCGGTIANLIDHSVKIKIVFIAEGSSCRFDLHNSKLALKAIKDRNNFAKNALNKLGIKNYVFNNLPCGRLDNVPIIEINKIIENNLLNFEPDTVFTHSENDANNDHKIVFKSTIMATRPTSKIKVKKLFSYEVLSSSEWSFDRNFMPNFFFQLTKKNIELKWKALKEYKTEYKQFPFPRSKEGLFTLAKYRGMQSGVEYAEAFKLIRQFA